MAFSRPKTLKGQSVRVKVGCGSLYITLNTDNGNLIEVIATLGKAGGCTQAQNEALGRVISTGLRYNVPVLELVEQLEDIRCPNLLPLAKEKGGLSCADGFAIALREWASENKKDT